MTFIQSHNCTVCEMNTKGYLWELWLTSVSQENLGGLTVWTHITTCDIWVLNDPF